ncbi:MAG: MazG family protein [Verrucomicrobiae bacterium]|nr:MazG family protein [Verrucomicrobiae bacterium]
MTPRNPISTPEPTRPQKPRPPRGSLPPLRQLLEIMAILRGPGGCPWDQKQDHRSLRWHAVEEVHELLDAIECGDDADLAEELGDLLLQVVFHAQLGRERRSFDFDSICRGLVTKLVRRHPHVFGETQARDVDQVWANWERIKQAEKAGSPGERTSQLDGIPRHLPGLMRAQQLLRKAVRAGLMDAPDRRLPTASRTEIAAELFRLAAECQSRGWSAEELLRAEIRRRERGFRQAETVRDRTGISPTGPHAIGKPVPRRRKRSTLPRVQHG